MASSHSKSQIWAQLKYALGTCCLIALLFSGGSLMGQTEVYPGDPPLLEAVKTHNLAMVKKLVAEGADVDSEDKYRNSAIKIATMDGQIEIVRLLLQKGAYSVGLVEKVCATGNNTLLRLFLDKQLDLGAGIVVAAEYGNLEAVKMLLAAGADVNTIQRRHQLIFFGYDATALQMAIKERHVEVAKYLVSRGASATEGFENAIYYKQNELAKYFVSHGAKKDVALICATEYGNVEMMKYLVQLGANREVENQHGENMMIIALKKGHVDAVDYCANALQMSLNQTSESGETSLMAATFASGSNLIDYLVEQGCKVDAVDLHGNTALIYAVRNDQPDAAAALLRLGADINHKNFQGNTAMSECKALGHDRVCEVLHHYGAKAYDQNDPAALRTFEAELNDFIPDERLINRMIEDGAPADAYDRNGETMLYRSVVRRDMDEIKFLLAHGANPSALNRTGQRAPTKSREIIQLLIRQGANINAKDPDGNTYLCDAIANNDLELAYFLIESNASLDAICAGSEKNALFKAVVANKMTLVRALVEAGASLQVVNTYNKNLMDVAISGGDADMIAYFRGKGLKTQAEIQAEIEAKIKAKIDNGNAFPQAIASNDTVLVQRLIDDPSAMTLTRANVEDALDAAIAQENILALRFLCASQKLDINHVYGRNEHTLLMHAAAKGKVNVVRYLLMQGASVNLKDFNGRTAEDLTTSREIQKILKKAAK